LRALLKCSGNEDLNPFIPVVLEALTNSNKIYYAVDKLAGCVFVQNVEAPALSIITPILIKGLNDRRIETKRKCCVIIDNMCKLVEHPKEILVFSQTLRHLLVNCSENISDPEARSIATKALTTVDFFQKSMQINDFSNKTQDYIYQHLKEEWTKIGKTEIETIDFGELIPITTNLCNQQEFSSELWREIYQNNMPETEKEYSTAVCDGMLARLSTSFEVKEDIFEDTEEGKDLYKGGFTLAYAALTLLNNAKLHLKRNRFYGLLGPNNCGKTTLMRTIANEQIEGFPKRGELRTVFVEHEIQEREVGEDDNGFPILNIDLCGVDWVVDCCNKVYDMDPPLYLVPLVS
jgi:elongation factor 3